jgi:hypothetical protein
LAVTQKLSSAKKRQLKQMLRGSSRKGERTMGERPLGQSIEFIYKNHRGDVRLRQAIPVSIWYGHTDWHKEEQWFMKAYVPDRSGFRDFALKDCDFKMERE